MTFASHYGLASKHLQHRMLDCDAATPNISNKFAVSLWIAGSPHAHQAKQTMLEGTEGTGTIATIGTLATEVTEETGAF